MARVFLMSVSLVSGLCVSAGAQPNHFRFTVPLDPSQTAESFFGHDTWLSPWQDVNYTLPLGGSVYFDFVFPEGHQLDTGDGLLDGTESIHLNIIGRYPPGTVPPAFPNNHFRIRYWLTGVDPADPGPDVPTVDHPWTSNGTPYPAVVNPATGDITYQHDYNMGDADFSFTDVHAELTATSLLSPYIIERVQIGFDRDNIYTTIPGPGTAALVCAGVFTVLGVRRR